MTPALKSEARLADDIDMERVVADADYRRRVVGRLRRERILARAQTSELALAENAADED